jgi:spermidine synthase
MGRKRAQAVDTASSIIGNYEISTGKAEVVADEFRSDAYVLYVNGVPSSHVAIGRPRDLDFEYMRWLAAAIEHFVDAHLDPTRLRVTHLGGAACTMARYFADVWPESRHTVVELDDKLAAYVREWFDIPRAPTVKIRVGEARRVTDSFKPATRDVIIRDVFAGQTTPESVATLEFFRSAHSSLAPGGLYISNCGDRSDLRFAKAELAGMAQVFEHVAVISDPAMLKGRRYGNIILLGSDTPLPAEGSPEAAALAKPLLAGAVPAQYKDERWTREFFSGANALIDED